MVLKDATVTSLTENVGGEDVSTVIDVGYTISGNPVVVTTTITDDNPQTFVAPSIAKQSLSPAIESMTASDGAFEVTIDSGDLKKRKGDGKSAIVVIDANGDQAAKVFTVTGTVTLGSDTVGKGKLLKISLSDWIDDSPDDVKIGGISHKTFLDEDGNADADPDTMVVEPITVEPDKDNAATFYVKVSAPVGLGTKTVVLFGDEERLASDSIEITAVGLTVSPGTAVAGQAVTVEGAGFTEKLDKLTVGGVGQTKLTNRNDVNDYDVLSGGRIVISFKVPDGVTAGSQTIQITDTDSRVGEVALTVPEPTITLEPDTSRRGTTVYVSGTGFPAESNITVDYGAGEAGIATGRTDGTGNFMASFTIPSSADIGGEVMVKASVSAGGEDYADEATHSVPDKEITVTPEMARSGDTIQIVGTGFPRFSDVEWKIGAGDESYRATTTRTDDIGDFTMSITMPGIDAGTHVLQVRAGDETGTWVLNVPEAPVITTRPSADVFEPLATAGVLTVVWHFDNDTKAWSFYDPRPEVAAAVDLTDGHQRRQRLDSGHGRH